MYKLRSVMLVLCASLCMLHADITVKRFRISIKAPVTADDLLSARRDFLAKKGTPQKASLFLRDLNNDQLAAVIKTFPDLKSITVSGGKEVSALPSLAGTSYREATLLNLGKLSNLTPLTECPTLESIKILGVAFTALPTDFFGKLPKLKHVYLSGRFQRNAPQTYDLAGIENAVNLTTLELSGNTPAPADLTPVSQAPNLKSLTFFNIRDLDLAPLSKGSKKLQKLSVSGLRKPKNLSSIGEIKSLTTLVIAGNELKDLGFIPQLPNLTSLKVSVCAPKSWEPLGRCTNLTELTVSLITKGPDLAQFIPQLATAKKLAKLKISGCNFSNELTLGELTTCPLTELDLGYNKRTDKTPVNLDFLPKLANTLTILKLSRIPTNNFTRVQSCTELTRLHADCKSFDLNAVTKLPKLRYLYVPKTQKDEAQKSFQGRKVYVTGINVK